MTNEHNAEYQMLRALRALRLELPREIVDDIGDRYMAVVDEKNREIERLRNAIREHSCGISRGCLCYGDSHDPESGCGYGQPFKAELDLKEVLDDVAV